MRLLFVYFVRVPGRWAPAPTGLGFFSDLDKKHVSSPRTTWTFVSDLDTLAQLHACIDTAPLEMV